MTEKPFSDLIRELRFRLRLNQTEMAEKLGVSQSMLSRWELGETPRWWPRAKRLMALMADGGPPYIHWHD